ncbi:NAD-dependent epimerase/dehydratase family protein [Acidobacteriia bacterium AH_259_A11_L15]|nr:NAD-dependent epimerase/dehydratase family protein [Acidobacteriia bacterium AH_259_A11_L15]
MEKILVLGGHGFLGANVVGAFEGKGYAVEAASRRTGVDARDESALTAFLERARPDVLVNCAAHVGGIAYNAQCPVAIYEDNLLLGFNLIRATFRCGVKKFVNIMPNCTYPGELDLYSEPQWWDGPMHPTVLTYGMPRKALWAQAWAYQQEHGFRSIHLVLPNLYGPRDHFDVVRSHALGALIRKVMDAKRTRLEEVEIWGTGRPIREWMYVEDAAEGVVLSTERYKEIEVLNLGSGQGCSIRELAEMIKSSVGWNGNFVYDTSRPDGAPRKILDVERMKHRLGWFPRVSLDEGIRRTVTWYFEHRDEYL